MRFRIQASDDKSRKANLTNCKKSYCDFIFSPTKNCERPFESMHAYNGNTHTYLRKRLHRCAHFS